MNINVFSDYVGSQESVSDLYARREHSVFSIEH